MNLYQYSTLHGNRFLHLFELKNIRWSVSWADNRSHELAWFTRLGFRSGTYQCLSRRHLLTRAYGLTGAYFNLRVCGADI